MKQAIILCMVLLLAGCGGVHKFKRKGGGGAKVVRPVNVPQPSVSQPSAPQVMPFASGPISQACMASDRKARSRQLCGCIQAVADTTLSNGQQRRAVAFYANPHLAQETRQSDQAGDERFWQAYKAYGEQAKRVCR